jgi:hypothetical protein
VLASTIISKTWLFSEREPLFSQRSLGKSVYYYGGISTKFARIFMQRFW